MNAGSKKTIKTLCFAVLGMFTFSFALVPLYNVFCEVTGLNGKIELRATNDKILRLMMGEISQFSLFPTIMKRCLGHLNLLKTTFKFRQVSIIQPPSMLKIPPIKE